MLLNNDFFDTVQDRHMPGDIKYRSTSQYDNLISMWIADIEKKIIEHSVKVFLLCSPHNPIERVWTPQELTNLGRICQRHNVYIISDEIHSDFVFEGNRHLPISVLSEDLAQRTVTCISPTKTFNLAGIGGASAVIPNAMLRRKVQQECAATGFGDLNMLTIAAATAAYRDGELWLDTLLSYLENNIRILREFCAEGLIRLIQSEGTYLMWLDCRMLSPEVPDAGEYFFQHAHVRLHKEKVFGVGGDGFVRMNIACPRTVLHEALYRMGEAIKKFIRRRSRTNAKRNHKRRSLGAALSME